MQGDGRIGLLRIRVETGLRIEDSAIRNSPVARCFSSASVSAYDLQTRASRNNVPVKPVPALNLRHGGIEQLGDGKACRHATRSIVLDACVVRPVWWLYR